MDKKHRLIPATAAALLAAVPATLMVHRHIGTAERASLERAAQKVLQHDAELPTAYWRKDAPEADRAVSTADIQQVEMHGDRAEVWVSEHTTPYVTDSNGENPTPAIAAVSSHLFVFERAGDGWRLAEDLTAWEFQDGG
ncbi:hypothetical protein ACIF70_10930 [Actinacidiphila glaucinigra]|uniref:hypothetical protein n=1 Tax=Actinacidiphila glaucinigra TaxID=235986 RepID=UPI0037C992A0